MPIFLTALLGRVPPWALKAAGIVLAVAAVLFAVHEWTVAIRHDAVATVAAQEEHVARVREEKIAAVTTTNAIHEAAAQDAEKEKTRVIVQKVPHYLVRSVPVGTPCVPWGLVRLHDAAALGLDPDKVVAPAGQPDDECSGVSPADLASRIAANYGIARQNAEQLNALEADIRQRIDAANGQEDNKHGSH